MEASPVKMRPQCFYSAVMENLKLDSSLYDVEVGEKTTGALRNT